VDESISQLSGMSVKTAMGTNSMFAARAKESKGKKM
jgi:hypothetical protein